MDKLTVFLETYFLPVATRIGANIYLNSIRDGCMISLPLLIVGSIFLLIACFPIPGYDHFMANIFGASWQKALFFPVGVTFDVVALLTVLGVAYSLAKKFDLDGIAVGTAAICAFLLITPFTTIFTPEGAHQQFEINGIIPLAWLGSKGLFIAIFTAVITCKIFQFVIGKNWVIKLPDSVPPAVMRSFVSVVPSLFTILIFWAIRLSFAATDFGTIHDFVYKMIQIPLQHLGNTLPALIIAYLLAQLLWWFGIHGQMLIFATVLLPLYRALNLENFEAYKAGTVLPNIVTEKFVDTFVMFGGSGCTLGLVIVMILFCRSTQLKDLGKLSFAPGLFNINEPIIFGLPIVYNPIMLIPFVMTPVIIATITYLAMFSGLCPYANGVIIPWTTPIFFNGFFESGWQGLVLQIFTFFVSILIYLPFIKIVDKQMYAQEQGEQAD